MSTFLKRKLFILECTISISVKVGVGSLWLFWAWATVLTPGVIGSACFVALPTVLF